MPIGTVSWIAEGMLGDSAMNVLSNAGPEPVGVAIEIRNQFFHGSHPLGWLRDIRMQLDETPVARLEISFLLDGHHLTVDQVRQTTGLWWQPRQVAHVIIARPGGVAPGTHAVELEMDVSTFFFTPEIDRNDSYPTMTLRLEGAVDVRTRPERLLR